MAQQVTVGMSVKTVLEVVPLLPPRTSIMFRGRHGIGKSQVMRQIAKRVAKLENIENYLVIDRRLSQMTEGDIIGLASTDGEVTRFNPPDWYKMACMQPCFLFLDELNRATPEVMQTSFQIALDGELNGWKLHPQTRVATAINDSARYTVNEMDPALLDRFWVCDLDPTREDWIEWATTREAEFGGPLDDVIVDFFREAANEKFLDPAKDADASAVDCSRRSWEKVNDALLRAKVIDNPGSGIFWAILRGFVGNAAAIAFKAFAEEHDRRVSGEEVVNSYDKVEKKIKKMTSDQLVALIDKTGAYVTKSLAAVNEAQGKNLSKFMKQLGGEHRISLWSQLTQQGIDKINLSKSIHKYCAESVLDVFGVPMGEAGIGVVPNIPGIFKTASGKK